MSPEQLGRYKLIKKLAVGGMAEIFLAEQSGPGHFLKRLVIKRILPHLSDDEKFLRMFQDEARVAALMNHPNVVQIFELGKENEAYYIAMEYVSGFNLRAVIQKSDKHGMWLAPEYIAKLGSQICEGLEYAHNFSGPDGKHLNLIHRDVSPQNIILSEQGIIKIVDFGIVKANSNEEETQAGIIKGKLAYMSPEQVRGMKLDKRSDIFSLGIVLYELATHQRPFHGKADIEMLRSIMDNQPISIQQIRPDFPVELSNIIFKALTKDREQRYASARELQWDLEKFIQSWGKPITPFQLQELISDLEKLDEETEKAKDEAVKKKESLPQMPPSLDPPSTLEQTPSDSIEAIEELDIIEETPSSPLAAVQPHSNPSPLDLVRNSSSSSGLAASEETVDIPKKPSRIDDFGDDETMWAKDIKLSPPSPQALAASGVKHGYMPPSAPPLPPPPSTQSPWPSDRSSTMAAPSWAPPPAASKAPASADDWEDDDATVLSIPPVADFLGQAPVLGLRDLDTLHDPNAYPKNSMTAESQGVSPEVAASYLSNSTKAGNNFGFGNHPNSPTEAIVSSSFQKENDRWSEAVAPTIAHPQMKELQAQKEKKKVRKARKVKAKGSHKKTFLLASLITMIIALSAITVFLLINKP